MFVSLFFCLLQHILTNLCCHLRFLCKHGRLAPNLWQTEYNFVLKHVMTVKYVFDKISIFTMIIWDRYWRSQFPRYLEYGNSFHSLNCQYFHQDRFKILASHKVVNILSLFLGTKGIHDYIWYFQMKTRCLDKEGWLLQLHSNPAPMNRQISRPNVFLTAFFQLMFSI